MSKKSISFLFEGKMNIKYWILVGILALGIVFLTMDNCGNSDKYNKLKGEYNTYKTISRVIVAEAIQTINKQTEEIKRLDGKIDFLQGIIEVKDEDLAEIEEDLGELKREFKDLQECQIQYNKLVEGFNLCKSISADKDQVIFNLQEKYEAQVAVSLEYKSMYESVQKLTEIRTKQIKELENINRRLRLTSKFKTGIVITMAVVVAYSLLKD